MHDSVNKAGHGLLPKTNSESSLMDFPLQRRVNERKQGSASQGVHCDPVHRFTFSSSTQGNLQEFGQFVHLSQEWLIPAWDAWKIALQHPAEACYKRGCLIMFADRLMTHRSRCQT